MKTSRIATRKILWLACWAVLAGSSEGVNVLNQIGPVTSYVLGGQSTISQIFTDTSAYDCMAIDDFTVSSSELRVTNVSALFQAYAGFAMFGNVAGYQLSFFSAPDAAGSDLLGDVGSLLVISGGGASVIQVNDDYGLVSLNVDFTLPAAGTYWVGVAPVAASLAGNFYLQSNGAQGPVTPGNDNGMVADPNDGYFVGPLHPSNVDYAYSVTAVPEPAAITLWLLGGLVALRRHRSRLPGGNR